MTDQEYFPLALEHLKSVVPGIRLKTKEGSLFHRAIDLLLWPIARGRYMDKFWTTIGYTISCARGGPAGNWDVLYHEGRHAYEAQEKTRALFGILYLFPQILAVPLVFIFSWLGAGVWSHLGLLLLLPLPSYWRARAEIEAYKVSMACRYWKTGMAPLERYVDHLTGMNYYLAWPFRDHVEDEFAEFRLDLYNGWTGKKSFMTAWKHDVYLSSIYDHMKKHGMVNV